MPYSGGSSGGVPKYSSCKQQQVTQQDILQEPDAHHGKDVQPFDRFSVVIIADEILFDVSGAWYRVGNILFTGQCTTITHGHLHRFVVQIVAGLIDRDAHQGKKGNT